MRKMALNGYILHVDLAPVRKLVSLQRRCANNLNQVAVHANTFCMYPEEIAGLQRDYERLWGQVSDVLTELSALVEKILPPLWGPYKKTVDKNVQPPQVSAEKKSESNHPPWKGGFAKTLILLGVLILIGGVALLQLMNQNSDEDAWILNGSYVLLGSNLGEVELNLVNGKVDISGDWQDSWSERCGMVITSQGDNYYSVDAIWASSASEYQEWTFSGYFGQETRTLTYSDGNCFSYAEDDSGYQHQWPLNLRRTSAVLRKPFLFFPEISNSMALSLFFS